MGLINSLIQKNNTMDLINACKNKMDDDALKLIETIESNQEHVDSNGHTALVYAFRNKMEITKLLNDIRIQGYSQYYINSFLNI
jgi:hypothetical protein